MTGEPLHPFHYTLHQGPLTIDVRYDADEDGCRIEARGRIDDATCRALRSVLLPEIEQRAAVLDASAVHACAASGADVVLEAAEWAASREQTFQVTTSSRALVRALDEVVEDAPPDGLLLREPAHG
jgi:anti-anti-sigma regulatory factor